MVQSSNEMRSASVGGAGADEGAALARRSRELRRVAAASSAANSSTGTTTTTTSVSAVRVLRGVLWRITKTS